ncbi:MAG: M23 family metallopeptidase, partial [Proteobacteria bacterium]|nr:M23 family metallopeptidase [Pseudomonadota bacterium]
MSKRTNMQAQQGNWLGMAWLGLAGLVAGCMPQQPAPVISGYQGGVVEVAAPSGSYVRPEQSAEAQTVEGQRYSLTRQRFVPVQAEAAPPMAQKVAQAAPATTDHLPMVKQEVLAKLEPAAGVPPQRAKEEVVEIEDAAPAEDATVGWLEHKVERGETIYKISKTYDASVIDIMAANEFEKPQDLKAGTLVRVPVKKTADAKGTAKVAAQPTSAPQPAAQPVQLTEPKSAAAQPTPTVQPTNKVEISRPVSGSATEELLQKFKTGSALPKRVEQLTAKALGEETAPVAEEPVVAAKAGLTNENIADNGSNDVKGAPSVKAIMEKPQPKRNAADELRAELKRGQIDPIAAKANGSVWPVRGKIIRNFGEQGNGVAHTGINIAVPPGTPVLAMDGGQVLYADEGLKSFGKLVLVRHKNGMVSAYAHNG